MTPPHILTVERYMYSPYPNVDAKLGCFLKMYIAFFFLKNVSITGTNVAALHANFTNVTQSWTTVTFETNLHRASHARMDEVAVANFTTPPTNVNNMQRP